MKEDDSNWFSRREEDLLSPDELMPLSQTLITPPLALAFDILKNPTNNPTPNNPFHLNPPPPPPPPPPSLSAVDSGDEPARTLKRPRLVWTPQLHKRFVDAVAHLGIKNAVPKTIMQLMSVDGLTRENVASHLQKYRLYLKRMQGLSSGGGVAMNGAAGGGDAATDQLFASSPVPAHLLHPGRPNSEHFLPFVPVTALQLQGQFERQMGHFGSPQSGQFEHRFLARPTQQPSRRIGAQGRNVVPGYVEDLESAKANEGRKALTLFPTGDD